MRWIEVGNYAQTDRLQSVLGSSGPRGNIYLVVAQVEIRG